jgi:hypothetical protein
MNITKEQFVSLAMKELQRRKDKKEIEKNKPKENKPKDETQIIEYIREKSRKNKARFANTKLTGKNNF